MPLVGYLNELFRKDVKLKEALKALDRLEEHEPRLVQAATLSSVLKLTEQWENDIRGMSLFW